MRVVVVLGGLGEGDKGESCPFRFAVGIAAVMVLLLLDAELTLSSFLRLTGSEAKCGGLGTAVDDADE